MAKLCAKGKAAAKRKFDVYPSAYANMYASAVCSGKIKPGGKKLLTIIKVGSPKPVEVLWQTDERLQRKVNNGAK